MIIYIFVFLLVERAVRHLQKIIFIYTSIVQFLNKKPPKRHFARTLLATYFNCLENIENKLTAGRMITEQSFHTLVAQSVFTGATRITTMLTIL